MSVNEPEVDSPWACVQNGWTRWRVKTVFLWVFIAGMNFRALHVRRPRAHSTAPAGNLLCRTDWLQLRGIAKSDCAILPIQEIAACLWCSACEHLGSGERLTARCALPSFEGLVPCYRCAGTADSLSSEHTDSISESEPVHWEWDVDVPEPPLPLQPTVPFQPQFLLQELIRAHCPFQPRWSTEVTSPSPTGSSFTSLPTADSGAPGNESSQRRAKHQKSVHHSGIHFASCSMNPLLARSVSWLREEQQQSLYGGAGQAVGGRRARRLVDSGRFVGAQHERTRYHLRGPCGTSRSRRHSTGPVAWSFGSGPPAVADSANDVTIRDGSSSPSEVAATVTVTMYSGVRVPPNNQPPTSLQHVATVSIHHNAT